MLTHEPQNREMALIRCPNCDTLHDLESSFFASGARKVRCASCRTIWEASDPETNGGVNVVLPTLDVLRESPAASMTPDKPVDLADILDQGPLDQGPPDQGPLDQGAIDAMDFSTPAPPDQENAETADISADELEALFADEAKQPAQSTADPETAKASGEPIEFDPASLARAQDAAKAASGEDDADERRRNRRAKRLAVTEAHHSGGRKNKGAKSVAVMLMAAGVGTLATLGVLRNETVRLFPGSAPVFEAVGLNVNPIGLDISEVKSRLVREENRETLEVTGSIVNLTKTAQKVPVMRLSIRTGSGQEIYVWTATADQPEIGPGEKSVFRRRLASPPAESHSVMVRFVAKDDIVAAVR